MFLFLEKQKDPDFCNCELPDVKITFGMTLTRPARADSVRIALTAAQVDDVVRTAADAGNMSLLLSGLGDVRAALREGAGPLENPRLSGSLLCGLLILASFPADGGYMSIKQISHLTGKSPSTAHRYISTLIAVGLLERDPQTREYRLARGRGAGSSADAG